MAERALMPDYLRLIALFGIVVVNVQFIAFPSDGGFFQATQQATGDKIAVWLVNGLASLKTYGLFSFMFGVGLAFQIRSAERRGLTFGHLYRNRMLGLFVLGVLHGVFFFFGDVLVVYSLTGALLYFWRGWAVRRLVKVGAALLLSQIVILSALLVSFPTMPDDLAAMEREVMMQGSFVDVAGYRGVTFAIFVPLALFFQGTAALGWFCLGLAAVKSGMIDNAAHPIWARARRLCLGPGLLASLAASAWWMWGDPVAGEVLVTIVAPISTLGYLGVIAALARPPGPLAAKALRAGRASLTVYLGQSICLSLIFSGYGLGLWDAVGPLLAVLIALMVTAVLIIAVDLWLSRFRLGPFEAVLRAITYAGATPAAARQGG